MIQSTRERVKGGHMLYQIDGIPFSLRRPADLGFLSPYGRCFRVWDRSPSGNLCFGMEGEYGRLFVKYGGAWTEKYQGHPRDAAALLKAAASLYEGQPEGLVRLLSHGVTREGYALVFAYEEGAALSGDPAYPGLADKLMFLPAELRLRMADTLFSLMCGFEKQGLLAVDFSGENLILNLAEGRLTLCDVDLYQPYPLRCGADRLPGEYRWLAPEESKEGAVLDARTAVYRLGMFAFDLFGAGNARKKEAWQSSRALFETALRAAQPDRDKRFPCVEHFLAAWRAAVGQTKI